MNNKPNYGIDAPRTIQFFFIASVVISLIYWKLGLYCAFKTGYSICYQLGIISAVMTFISFFATGCLMLLSSLLYGKFYVVQKMLNQISWSGHEKVLDVGCGRGLVMIQVAKKLSDGHVTGIDIFQSKDLSSNSINAVMENAQIEGVDHKISVKMADMLALPFADQSFDVVVSNLAVHNLADQALREQALLEMIRVCKSSGYILINDIFCTAEYYDYLTQFDELESMTLYGYSWQIFPFSRILKIQKKTVKL